MLILSKKRLIDVLEKCLYLAFFQSAFSRIWAESNLQSNFTKQIYKVIFRVRSEYGKMQATKTPNTYIFHAVNCIQTKQTRFLLMQSSNMVSRRQHLLTLKIVVAPKFEIITWQIVLDIKQQLDQQYSTAVNSCFLT